MRNTEVTNRKNASYNIFETIKTETECCVHRIAIDAIDDEIESAQQTRWQTNSIPLQYKSRRLVACTHTRTLAGPYTRVTTTRAAGSPKALAVQRLCRFKDYIGKAVAARTVRAESNTSSHTHPQNVGYNYPQ